MAGKGKSKVHVERIATDGYQLGMFLFVVSNIVGSTIQITTLPLPVLSTLQAVCAILKLMPVNPMLTDLVGSRV